MARSTSVPMGHMPERIETDARVRKPCCHRSGARPKRGRLMKRDAMMSGIPKVAKLRAEARQGARTTVGDRRRAPATANPVRRADAAGPPSGISAK